MGDNYEESYFPLIINISELEDNTQEGLRVYEKIFKIMAFIWTRAPTIQLAIVLNL